MKPKPFRLLVTGSRSWPEEDAYWIHRHLDAAFAQALDADRELVIVHGDCKSGPHRGGVDRYADDWCIEVSCLVERWPANWDELGKSAGFKRNADMVNSKPKIDLCAAFIRDNSAGATHCQMLARAAGIPTWVGRW